MIDCWGSLRHYRDHLAAVWRALPAEVRGTWSDAPTPHDGTRPIMVAGWRDAQAVRPRPVIYLEHGAGQTYGGDPRGAGHGSYAGGGGLDHVLLFLCPSRRVADLWRQAYPSTPAAVVGSPKLDPWHGAARWAERPAGLTVAVTFHAEIRLVPETRSAWSHWDAALPALAREPGVTMLGHGHPRLWPTIRRRWQQLGVEQVREFGDVLDRADLLVMDNTSAGYEFASTGRPVLVLNAPWYRRHVDHGLRFWSHPPGIQIDQPGQLVEGVWRAAEDGEAAQAIRRAAVAATYSECDGFAAQRAVAAIMEVCHAPPSP